MTSTIGSALPATHAVALGIAATAFRAPTEDGGVPVLVGRQGVYQNDLALDGYELLFRSRLTSLTSESDLSDNQMTADVLISALDIGLEELVGDRRIYINVAQDLLQEPWDSWLPPHRTVVELLEDVMVTPELLAGCRSLIERGFTIALDDFVWFEGAEALLELASIVKIDLLAVAEDEVEPLAKKCSEYDVVLLAEKVEDIDQLEWLRSIGFTLFQGYALELPQIVASRTVDMTSLARLRSAAMMLDADIEVGKLERMIRTEPGIAYQLIRLASIGRIGEMRREVKSLRDAIVLLGVRKVQQFVAILLARPGGRDFEPSFIAVLVRARACEVLTARKFAPSESSVGFAAGLISALDTVLGIPVPELVASMNLTGALADALLDSSAGVGAVLADIVAYQLDEPRHLWVSSATPDDLEAAFADAFNWATETMSAVIAAE